MHWSSEYKVDMLSAIDTRHILYGSSSKRSRSVTIKDNFPQPLARKLRQYAMSCITQGRYKGGYDIIQFWYDSDPLTKRGIDFVEKAFKKQLGGKTFQQGWFFIHDNKCPGVGVHADPANVNINIWLTPDESVQDWTKNGLIVHNKVPPKSWSFEDYNTDGDRIRRFLKQSNAKKTIVSYKYCRMILFNSRLFHSTNGVHMKPGPENKRINMSLLFS